MFLYEVRFPAHFVCGNDQRSLIPDLPAVGRFALLTGKTYNFFVIPAPPGIRVSEYHDLLKSDS